MKDFIQSLVHDNINQGIQSLKDDCIKYNLDYYSILRQKSIAFNRMLLLANNLNCKVLSQFKDSIDGRLYLFIEGNHKGIKNAKCIMGYVNSSGWSISFDNNIIHI